MRIDWQTVLIHPRCRQQLRRNLTMNPADFDELDDSEKAHFYKCEECGQMVDMRQLDDVLFHEDHVHRTGHSIRWLGKT
jgi:hypothetical protein